MPRLLYHPWYNAVVETDRRLVWMGSSRDDLRAMPTAVQRKVGFGLRQVQQGERPAFAQTLQGFGGGSVIELKVDVATNAYRAVYTVQFADAVYVLHVFQKKATQGRATPQREMELVRRRLAEAHAQHREDQGG